METALLRKRITDTIEQAKRAATARRSRAAAAAQDYSVFLDTIAVPLFRQCAQTLKAAGYPFSVFTPSGSVRLMSDRSADDYIELSLDASGEGALVIGHVSHARGRRIAETERAIAERSVGQLSEEDLLTFLLTELAPFVER